MRTPFHDNDDTLPTEVPQHVPFEQTFEVASVFIHERCNLAVKSIEIVGGNCNRTYGENRLVLVGRSRRGSHAIESFAATTRCILHGMRADRDVEYEQAAAQYSAS
jgi:hypothetical protein